MLSRLVVMGQAAVFDGQVFDLSPSLDDGVVPAEVDVGGGEVGCPSSKRMGLLSVFHREDLAHLCLMLSRLALMVQAAVLGGQFFDLFSLFDDGGVASKVGVGWSYVADALVVALVVVVIDEGADLVFEIAG